MPTRFAQEIEELYPDVDVDAAFWRTADLLLCIVRRVEQIMCR